MRNREIPAVTEAPENITSELEDSLYEMALNHKLASLQKASLTGSVHTLPERLSDFS